MAAIFLLWGEIFSEKKVSPVAEKYDERNHEKNPSVLYCSSNVEDIEQTKREQDY